MTVQAVLVVLALQNFTASLSADHKGSCRYTDRFAVSDNMTAESVLQRQETSPVLYIYTPFFAPLHGTAGSWPVGMTAAAFLSFGSMHAEMFMPVFLT